MIEDRRSDAALKIFENALEAKRSQAGVSSVRTLQEQVFFNYYFDSNQAYLGTSGTVLQVNRKVLNLHDKKLRVSYIHPIINYNINEMKEIIDTCSQRDLITMIYSEKDPALEALGFEAVIEQQVANIPSQLLPEFNVQGIVLDPTLEQLKQVFDTYSSHFTGYFQRSIEDFQNIRRDTHYLKGKIVGFSDGEKLKGYIRSIHHGSYVEVLECCYDTSGTLLRLLSFVSKGTVRIIYHTNISEKIYKILPDIKVDTKVVMLARINDKELFERLFHIKIISSYSAFNAFSKPVLNHDTY